jgi:hypothetical protein
MTRHTQTLAPPRNRDDAVLVRDARQGAYWQSADGLIVRLCAREMDRDAGSVRAIDREAKAARVEVRSRSRHDEAPATEAMID